MSDQGDGPSGGPGAQPYGSPTPPAPPPRRYPTTPPPVPSATGLGGGVGLLTALFDLTFHRFVTTRVVTFIYALVMAAAALYTLALLAVGFRIGVGVGLLFLLVVCPLFFLLVVAVYRVLLELAVVIFRIHESLDVLVRRGDQL